MLKRTQVALLFIALIAIPGASAFADDNPLIVGSWEAISVLDGTTDEIPALFTFGAGGTLVAAGPTSSNSTSHGAWRQVGERKFKTTEVSFLYGPGGTVIGTISARAKLKVSNNGKSYTATFEGEVSIIGGPTDPFSGTAAGSRIGRVGTGDDDSDSDSDSD